MPAGFAALAPDSSLTSRLVTWWEVSISGEVYHERGQRQHSGRFNFLGFRPSRIAALISRS